MFFYAAKLLWFVLQPSCFIAFLLLLGTIMVWTYWARWGRRLVALGVVLLFLAGLSPLGQALILPLEDRFPRTDLKAGPPPTGFIVLGGAEDRLVGAARHAIALNEAGERYVEAAILARRFPQAKIAFSGGDAGVVYRAPSEASGAANVFTELGIAPDRLVLESKARDTYENAVFTKKLLAKRGLLGPGTRWVLITSAFHMPRAIGCFRKAGLDVEAWPVDYRTRGPIDLTRPFNMVSEGLRRVDLASKEWVGLLVYWLRGRTSALLPAPEPAIMHEPLALPAAKPGASRPNTIGPANGALPEAG